MVRGVKPEDWTSPDGLAALRRVAGGTKKDIAAYMGISSRTLERWCQRNEALRAVLYDRDMCAAVERQVYACCFDRVKVVKIKKQVLDKAGGVHELTEEKEVVIPADGRAQTYWLNNRNPDRWRAKVEVDLDGQREITVHLADDTEAYSE